jgi:hypothetical protein
LANLATTSLTDAVTLAVLEQARLIEGCKPLATGVDIADHGHELAPKDLRMREAALGDTATRLGSVWAGKTFPLIQNAGRGGQGDGNHGTASE